MEHDICNIIYLDRRAREERLWTRDQPPAERPEQSQRATRSTSKISQLTAQDEVEQNVRSVLSVFPTGQLVPALLLSVNCRETLNHKTD